MNQNKRCNCVVVMDKESCVLTAKSKCRLHVQELLREMHSEEQHYKNLGAMDHPAIYEQEFTECFGDLQPGNFTNSLALEIGAGTSPYINMIRKAGYTYTAVEPSKYAAQWLRERVDIDRIAEADWEEVPPPVARYDVILAAHCIEHMKHAPSAIAKMADALVLGGSLYIIVPNDEDLYNPDHWWFFTPTTLRSVCEDTGLIVEKCTTRQRISREQFIYCQAVKRW